VGILILDHKKIEGDQRAISTRLWLNNLAALLLAAIIPLAILSGYTTETFSAQSLAILLSSLSFFIIADLVISPFQPQIWKSPLNFILIVTWLTTGMAAALMIALIGSIAVVVFHPYAVRLPLFNYSDRPQSRSWATARDYFIVYGLVVVVAALIYDLMGGRIPLTLDIIEPPILIVTLVLSTVVARIAEILLNPQVSVKEVVRSRLGWEQTFRETILLFFSVLITLIYTDDHFGLLLFLIFEALILYLVVRSTLYHSTQRDLQERIQELSLLGSVVQDISSDLLPQNVLNNTYQWIKTYTGTPWCYFALYDGDSEVVKFPLVMINDQDVDWTMRLLDDDPWIREVLHQDSRKTLVSWRSNPGKLADFWNALPDTPDHQMAVGIPLVAGAKTLGLLTVVKANANNFHLETLETVAHHTSLALRNATLYERNVRFAENLSKINKDIRDMMFNLDGSEAMEVACRAAIDITGASQAAILLLDHEDGSRLTLAHHHELALDLRQHYGQSERLSDHRQTGPTIVPNVAMLDAAHPMRQLAQRGCYAAFVEIPLRSGNATIGKFVVFHDHAHQFERTEIDLLQTLAYQMSAALDNAELLDALEVYASEQAQLVHLSSISASSLNLQEVSNQVAAILKQMLSVNQSVIGLMQPDSATIRLYNPEQTDSRLVAVSQIPELAAIVEEEIPEAQIYHQNQAANSAGINGLMLELESQMLAIVPMITNNMVIGVVLLGESDGREFSDSEWRFIEMATNQIATQFYNVQLYQETEEALNRRLQELSFIENIASQISQSLNLDLVIRNVLKAAVQATQSGIGVVALLTDSGQLHFTCLEIVDGEFVDFEFTDNIGVGVVSTVIQASQPLIVPDNSKATGYISPGFHNRYTSSLLVPLIVDDRTIGGLEVESPEPNYFTEEHLNFIKNLAGHASISIQNARLLQERQSQIEMLTRLRDLSVALSSTLESAAAYPIILQTALAVAQAQDAQLLAYHAPSDSFAELATLSSEPALRSTIWLSQPVLRDIVREGETRLIPDTNADPQITSQNQAISDQFGSMLITPIKRDNVVQEVLCVAYKQPRTQLEAERDKIELLAFQVSGHLQNLHLYGQIRSNNNRMRAILDSTREGVLLLDRSGLLIDGNVSAEKMLGLSLENVLGLEFAETLHKIALRKDQQDLIDKGLEDLARSLRLNPRNISSHKFQIRVSGQIRHIDEIESPVFDQYNQIIGRLLTLRDVTEEILLEEYREEVIHMLVHDLREPLSSIIGSMNFLEELTLNIPDPDDTVTQLLRVSLSSAINLYNLVETILDIYKMENRRMPLNRDNVSIVEVIDATISKLIGSIREANINVTQDIPDDVPQVYIDADIIHRVLTNLLGNAIRYTPSGGQICFKVTADDAHQLLTIRVADSGPGIPVEEAERIFEKFRQIDNHVPQRGHKGSGVGLAFCKTAIEAHDEKIWVEPDGPLPGACFAFTLPYANSR
jgi:PAS domain S-box-containing protein